MSSRRTALIVLTLLVSLLSTAVLADELITQGDEFQANTFTTANQGNPEVAMDAQGRPVVVWESSSGQDGNSWGIFGQRYAFNGTPEGDEFQVNTYTIDLQVDPAIDRNAQGDFVVTWMSYFQTGGDEFDIFAQRFDSAGTAIGGELQVNTFTTGYQGNPDVALDDAGNFLVVWESIDQDGSLGGIYGQRFDGDGNPAGSEFRVNTTTASDQNDPVAAAHNNGFIVVWEDEGFDGGSETVVLQALDASGGALGSEVQVNTYTPGNQEDPNVAVAADGTFAISWESTDQDGSDDGIFAQVFDATRQPVGSEVQMNVYTLLHQEDADIASDGQGGFMVVWESDAQVSGISGDDIIGRQLSSQGMAVGDEIQINSEIDNDQNNVGIAGANGQIVAAWRSFGAHDGDAAGVFAQRHAIAIFADGFEGGDTASWSTTTP